MKCIPIITLSSGRRRSDVFQVFHGISSNQAASPEIVVGKHGRLQIRAIRWTSHDLRYSNA